MPRGWNKTKNLQFVRPAPLHEARIGGLPGGSRAPQAEADEGDSPFAIFSSTLRDGAGLLRLLLCFLAIIFLFSNIYWVEEGSVALHTRFGRLVGSAGKHFIPPGGPYWAMPYPIDKITKIPTTIHTLSLDGAFDATSMYPRSPGDQTYSSPGTKATAAADEGGGNSLPANMGACANSLAPGRDGFLVTGDKNIVQGNWEISYKLDIGGKRCSGDSPVLFAENIGDMQKAARLIRNIVEREIVAHVASMTVDDFVKGAINDNAIMQASQRHLDGMRSGISITSLSSKKYGVPKSLVEVFQSVNKAQSEKANQIEKAKQYRSEALNEAAGVEFQRLLDAIESYELAEAQADEPGKKNASDRFHDAAESASTSGRVAAILEGARTYKTKTVEFVRAASSRFSMLLEQHEENPDFMEKRLFEESAQAIFSGNARKFHLPKDRKKTIYLELDSK